ncbi:methionine ABC transporter ATP-binding protein [Shouchella lehensis]|uniref:Methionine import ATP-binding protein n=2 Tax=Shouchella lehensis TaxID=300825 RepID=A0A060M634_9BACI|nr:ATP-binding cassette domain-containing protein [Shouchella lehensis]AIC95534.1 methionine import ATP-binding protein [Shouchella lehensis G1]MBG9783753.1 methionine ABC transporter ATP-binding protein [Shouchella lehensis]RQW21261.1 ATP-binding cassette domain-containing protein [Bacillus sp. C1-1]TES51290.1 ATP-binding cassette domain-containing protein [Shouchella lehensis]
MISLTGISKTYATKTTTVHAVDQVDLHISKGNVFGIIGYSGAGKSTLVRLLNLLERPTTGEVLLDGVNLATLGKQALREERQKIGMIFQHFNLLWSRTVKENISFPLEVAKVPAAERKKRIEELIDLVGLRGRENNYPAQLSGGQKQRVGIARALANNPKVLLCDEATSALDPKTTDSILDLLTDINKKLNLTIVLITHEMHVIQKICHEVAVMSDGKIVEQGPVIDVFRRPKEAMTKEFVKQVAHVQSDELMLDDVTLSEGEQIFALTFIGNPAEDQLVTELIRSFPIDISILQGNISKLQQGSYGKLYLRVAGEQETIVAALEWIRSKQVEVEVLKHA